MVLEVTIALPDADASSDVAVESEPKIAYLKDAWCPRCHARIVINAFYDQSTGTLVVDGGTCRGCLKEVVLPVEEYNCFVRQHGIFL